MMRTDRRSLRTALVVFLLTLVPPGVILSGSLEDGVDAVILEDITEIDVRSVTDATVRHVNRTKVLTKRGVEKYGVASVGYGPGVSVRNLRGAITSPSGKVTKVGKKQIFDGADFPGFVLYADSRHRSIRFPGLAPGAIVEHSYETAMNNLRYLPGSVLLQEFDPIRVRSLTVHVPTDFPLRFSLRGAEPRYEREEKNGRVTHRWVVENVPGLWLERAAPPEQDLFPRILIRPKQIVWGDRRIDAETWDGIARFYWDLARDRMVPAPEVAQKARSLTAGATDPLEKTRILYEFARSKINYVAIALDIGGLQPHSNGDVLRHLYGDCKDKATLLIAMLRSVGLTGYPVLINTRTNGLIDRDIPALTFNHAIAAVPADDGYLFMDPTSETTPFGDLPWIDQGVPVLVIREDGRGDLTETPLFAGERNRRRIRMTGRITPTGAMEGEVVIDAYGQVRDYYTPLLDARAEVREDAFSDLMSRLSPGARLESQKVEAPGSPDDPLRVTGRLTVPGLLTRAGSIEIVSPHVARFPELTYTAAYSGRRHPFFFPYLYNNTVEARIELPYGRTLKKIPEDRTIEGPGVRSTSSYELVREGGKSVLVVRRSLEVSRREIPVEEYSELHAFVSALAREEAGAVTLKAEI